MSTNWGNFLVLAFCLFVRHLCIRSPVPTELNDQCLTVYNRSETSVLERNSNKAHCLVSLDDTTRLQSVKVSVLVHVGFQEPNWVEPYSKCWLKRKSLNFIG